MRELVDKNSWERKDLFNYYDDHTNPFLSTTSIVDVTNIYNYCKQTKNSFYGTLGFIINNVVNKIDAFKLRKENDNIYVYDTLHANFTENIDDKKIGFFTVNEVNNYKKFIEEFNKTRQDLFDGKITDVNVQKYDEIWISCEPWFEFNSLSIPSDKRYTIPVFIWDKFRKENDKVYINLFVTAHHGFVDGSHLGKFYKNVQEEINNFKGDN